MNQIHLAGTISPDPSAGLPTGLLGFLVVVAIGLVTWVLGRSMAKHLRKLNANSPEQQEDGIAQTERDAAPRDAEPNGAH